MISPVSKFEFDLQNTLRPEDFVLSWTNLQERFHWESFVLRLGQTVVFDLKDRGNGSFMLIKT